MTSGARLYVYSVCWEVVLQYDVRMNNSISKILADLVSDWDGAKSTLTKCGDRLMATLPTKLEDYKNGKCTAENIEEITESTEAGVLYYLANKFRVSHDVGVASCDILKRSVASPIFHREVLAKEVDAFNIKMNADVAIMQKKDDWSALQVAGYALGTVTIANQFISTISEPDRKDTMTKTIKAVKNSEWMTTDASIEDMLTNMLEKLPASETTQEVATRKD